MKLWAAVTVLLLMPALALGQSLGEAARKEKERRKKNQEAGVKVRTITDQEVATDTEDKASPPSTPAAPPSSSATSPSGGSPPASRPALNEQEWRFKFSQARSKKQKADERYNFLNGLSLVNGEYYVDENGKPVITSLEQLRKMISDAKREADDADKALHDLEDQARRAGVPPGWQR